MEGVAVGIGQAGDGHTPEGRRIKGAFGVWCYRGDAVAVGRNGDTVTGPTRKDGVLAPPAGHDPTRSTNRVMRSTNASR